MTIRGRRTQAACGLITAGFLAGLTVTARSFEQVSHRGKSVVIGRVTTGLSGPGIGQAIVTLRGRPSSTFLERTSTTTSGDFAFLNVPAGIYDLGATKEGHSGGGFGQRRAGGLTRAIVISEAEHQSNVRLPLWPDGSICGTVFEDGVPTGGIAVSAMGQVAAGGRVVLDTRARGWTITDDRGQYRIGGLTPGKYVVGVLPVTGDSLTGGPIGAASQRASSLALGPAFYPGVVAPGAAVFMDVNEGEDHCGIDFSLGIVAGFELTGRARLGPADKSLVAQVTLRDDGLIDDLVLREAEVHPDGSFQFSNVPPGEWVIRVLEADSSGAANSPFGSRRRSAASRYTSLWGESTVQLDRDRRDLEIEPTPRIAANCRIIFQGTSKPPTWSQLPPIQIRLAPASGRELVGAAAAFVRVQSEQFLLAGLPPGRYSLQVGFGTLPRGWALAGVELNGRPVAESALDLHRDGATLDIILTDQVSEIAGTVSDSTGVADMGAQVIVFPEDSRLWTWFGRESLRMRAIQVDQNGVFRLRGLPVGEYFVAAIADEDARFWQSAPFLAQLAKAARRLTVRSGESATISLTTIRVR